MELQILVKDTSIPSIGTNKDGLYSYKNLIITKTIKIDRKIFNHDF